MIPVSLTLKGFLSYKNETEIDLSLVDVACVSGANGAGKSSLFDAMTWALFGRARRNDDALINDTCDECSVSFVFDYENNRYRVLREKPRGKGTGLEFQIMTADSDWKPLTESGLRATEDRIRDVLSLDYDTFINASFFLQGKADMFTQQPAARRKEILSSILGLDVWESYRAEANQRRRNVSEEVKGLHTLLSEVEQELGQEGERQERLELLTRNLKTTTALREEKEGQFLQAQSQVQALKSEADKLDMIRRNVESGRRRLADTDERRKELSGQLESYEKTLADEKAIENRYQNWQALREELERWNDLSLKSHELVTRRSKLESAIQAEKARLEQEQESLHRLQGEIADEESRRSELALRLDDLKKCQAEQDKKLAEMPDLEKQAAEAQNGQGELAAENRSLREQMDDLKQHMVDLEGSKGGECPLCGQELTDEHREEVLQKYQEEGQQLGDRYRANEKARAELGREIEELTASIDQLRALNTESVTIGRDVASLSAQVEALEERQTRWQQKDAARLLEVEQALSDSSFSKEAREKRALIDVEIKTLGYDESVHAAVRSEEAELRAVEGEYHVLVKARTAVAGLKRELSALEEDRHGLQEEFDSQSIVAESMQKELAEKQEKLPDLSGLEAELEKARLEENYLRNEVGGAQQMVNVLDARRKQKADLTREMESLNRRVSQLKLLEIAFGKDGVPALLIEQALPEIETQANDLLDRLSDGRMSVSFETEREYKDKKREDKRQTLDILISDASGRREYELFSGGEAFRINFAIRLALSRVLAGRAGARLQTLVIDEGFGSQDAEGRQRLIEAIHLVSQDFAKILVITHLDELKDAFPSRIEVTKENGSSRVEVIA